MQKIIEQLKEVLATISPREAVSLLALRTAIAVIEKEYDKSRGVNMDGINVEIKPFLPGISSVPTPPLPPPPRILKEATIYVLGLRGKAVYYTDE